MYLLVSAKLESDYFHSKQDLHFQMRPASGVRCRMKLSNEILYVYMWSNILSWQCIDILLINKNNLCFKLNRYFKIFHSTWLILNVIRCALSEWCRSISVISTSRGVTKALAHFLARLPYIIKPKQLKLSTSLIALRSMVFKR